MSPRAQLRRRALAAMAFAGGTVVDAERIIDAVWGEQMPASARKVLQNHVLALRRELGEAMIRTQAGGYALSVTPDEIDACRFETLVKAGRIAQRRGDHHSALRSFDEALGQWRGDPYLDLVDWPAAQGEIARLVELRRAAVEDRFEVLLALGEHAAAVADIEESVAEEQLRERRWQLLMTALYRAGRQAEALRAFQRARDLLIGQLGLEPSPALRRLEASILAQDAELDWHGEPTAVSHVSPLADECEELVRLAEAEYLASDPMHRSTGIAAARLADHIGEPSLLVRASLAGIRQIEAAPLRVDPDRVTMLRRAVDAADSAGDEARLLAALASELNASPDYRERRTLSDRALALARQSGDDGVMHHVLAARFTSIRAPDTLTERLANAAEDLAIVDRLADHRAQWGALCNTSTARLEVGDHAGSEAADAAAGALALSLGHPSMLWRSHLVSARQLTFHGDLPGAREAMRQGLDVGRAAGELADYTFAGQLYVVRWMQGQLAKSASQFAAIPLERAFDRAFACHAFAHASQHQDARQLLVGLAARGFSDVPYDGLWLTAMALIADAAVHIGATDVVEAVHDLLAPWRSQVVVTTTMCLGSVAHYVGMLAAALGRSDEADEAFAVATELHDRMNAPFWSARTRAAIRVP
jgi:DNA-binding SARP family transcriptional activator